MKILLADDALEIMEMFRKAFKLSGHETQMASNGLEAIEMVRIEPFDAIIIDIDMPDMTDCEIVRTLRALPHGAAGAIILLTAFGDADEGCHIWQAGADLLLHKPVLPVELLARTKALVGARANQTYPL